MNPNAIAFLAMISHSEGTSISDTPYRVCYGYKHMIVDMSDHPCITGEWDGESLAGLGAPYLHSISTAAGRYQINKATWIAVGKARLKLSSFNEAAQDDAAIELIKMHGGFAFMNAGAFDQAVQACANCWASLPGGSSGQPEHTMAALADVFVSAGGSLA